MDDMYNNSLIEISFYGTQTPEPTIGEERWLSRATLQGMMLLRKVKMNIHSCSLTESAFSILRVPKMIET